VSDLITVLKAEEYDYIIDLHNNLRTFRIKQALNVKNKSFNKLNIEKWFKVNFKWNTLPPKHIVDRYLEAASEFKIKNDLQGLDYFIPTSDEVNTIQLGSYYTPQEYVAIAIGAQHSTKRLPLHKLIELCQNIQRPIVLLGGKEDDVEASKILTACSNRTNIYNACGKFNLNQSASIVKQAKYVVSHDTGLMHIAAAFHKEIWSIWGNTVPEFGMYPYQTLHHIVEVKKLPCRPCSKIGHDQCPKGHFQCMENQDLSFAKSL
jgi:ADP-heptose:LPS heptosyltransferase